MKRTVLIALMLTTGMMAARAQSSFTTTSYQDKMQPALVLELPNSADDAQGTILQKLKETGYNPETKGSLFWKTNKKDGYYVFNNVHLPSVSTELVSMYFKVVEKKRDKNSSTVYLIVSNGPDHYISPDTDTALWRSSQEFLNSFVATTSAYSPEQDIKEQQAALEKSEKKLQSLQDDQKKLEGKLKSNADDQKLEQLNIINKRKTLQDLILKRKS